ncbi:protein kinase, partial [Nocardiopsis sp. MG754419]|uniref:protein kinase domain-containing protein n=1 Tax=Nocardiopsis sp. MG754419 TaxID=2259865 RepID=UPI001BAC3C4B
MDFSSPALPPNVTPLTDGDPFQVGPYRLVGRLGADGLGTLYAAVSPDHETMALKVAAAAWAVDAETAGEVAPAPPLGGVCAVGVRDSGIHEDRPWSAMGYVPGFELQHHLRAQGPFGGERLLVLAAGLAEALATFHSLDMVHGDMRPDNVTVAGDGPKVLDFGITRRIDPSAPAQCSESLGWLAPERYERGSA